MNRAIPELYEDANAENALEWASGSFWNACLQAWAMTRNVAIMIDREAPPDEDPGSEYRLKRVDVVGKAFANQSKRRLTFLFCELKSAGATPRKLQEVEIQAQRACEAYLNAPNRINDVVFAMCCVGTSCRAFKYIKDEDFDWKPMWGSNSEADATLYFDAGDPLRSIYIWQALNSMLNTIGVPLADESYL